MRVLPPGEWSPGCAVALMIVVATTTIVGTLIYFILRW